MAHRACGIPLAFLYGIMLEKRKRRWIVSPRYNVVLFEKTGEIRFKEGVTIPAVYARTALSSIALLFVGIFGDMDTSSGSLILAADTNRGASSTTGSRDRDMDTIPELTIVLG